MNVCGICDFRKKVSLGSLLFIICLTKIHKNIQKKKSVLEIITNQKLDRNILNVAKGFDFLDRIEILSSIKIKKNYFYFQKVQGKYISQKIQNSTIELQKQYKKKKFINELVFKKKLEENLSLKFKNKFKYIAVNLKIDKKNKLGNAKLSIWFNFFKNLEKEDSKFVLIGNNKYPKKFYKLKNLIVFPKKNSLLKTLIISKKCDFFIGNATGISAINILNNKPYLIFKHPNHHPKIFKKELLDKKKLLFQTKNQFIINKFENEKILLKYYEKFKK